MPNSNLLHGFYLGDRFVEPLKGQVLGQAESRHLPPKAVAVLLCLAREPGVLVPRDRLIEQVWGPGQGSSEALSHAVSEIRHALDDHVDNPAFIQTVPKRGYRLIVEPRIEDIDTSTIVIGAGENAKLDDIGLFENLKQRGVIETALAYLIVGWLLIQVADIVFDQLHFPEWAATFVTALVIAGFPIAIVLSWFLEFRDGRAILDPLSVAASRKRRFSRTYLSVIGALAVAAIGVYLYDQRFGLPEAHVADTPATPPEVRMPPVVENSFAVLPFVNLDGSSETQVFADGLVDDVITQLSRVPGLRIAARGDSFSLAPNSASSTVRNRLRVEMYIEGSVEMAEDKMRVTVQLIDSESGFHVLSRSFDRPRDDFFDIRDEITSLTVANVRVALPPRMRDSASQGVEDPSLDAYVLYRHGIEDSRKPISTSTIASALGWFDAALSVDPEYAAAYAGKCDVYVRGYAEVDDAAFIDDAESTCRTALSLNPNLDVVHIALGHLYQATGRHDEAVLAYQQALQHDPPNVDALTGIGRTFLRMNRTDEAEESLRSATDIHPGNASAYNTLGMFLYQTGRFAEAVEQYQYVVSLDPENARGFGNLGTAHMMMNNFAAAAPAFQKAIDLQPTKPAYSNLGLMHYYLGNFDAAIENHRHAVELQPGDHLARSNLGDALWVAGRKDEALHQFGEAEKLARRALEVNPKDPFTLMDLSWISAMLDHREEARSLIDQARALAPDDPYSHYYDALVSLRAGQRDAALAALTAAVNKGYSRQLLSVEPHLAPLKNDPRFMAIVNAG